MEFLSSLATVGIALILLVYTVLLVKLKIQPELGEKKERPAPSPPAIALEESAAVVHNVTQTTQPSTEEKNHSTSYNRINANGAQNKKEETRKNSKGKPVYLLDEKSFEGCSFKFGHLKTVPRSSPIPNECFGCTRIVECGEFKKR